MSKNTTTSLRSPVARLTALGSVLLLGAAATAFSVTAWAGEGHGPRGVDSRHAHHHVHHDHGDHKAKFAKHGHGPRGASMDAKYLNRLLGDAKLTDAQRQQIQDIRSKTREDLKALAPAPGARMAPAWGLLAQEKPDLVAAERERQARLSHQDQVSKRLLKEQADIANVLTPQQRAKLASELKARQDRWEARMKQRAERLTKHHEAKPAADAASKPR